MPVTGRNQLKGRSPDVILGTVMAHTTIEVGESVTESVVTSRSADVLNLKKDDCVIKDVLVANP